MVVYVTSRMVFYCMVAKLSIVMVVVDDFVKVHECPMTVCSQLSTRNLLKPPT